MKALVVIPAFNEEKKIADVLRGIPARVNSAELDVLVINDGSNDGTDKVVRDLGVKMINHPVNRGLGAALGTGFEYARRQDYDLLVTLDADGQHDPSEIDRLVEPVTGGRADFVVGTRIFKKGMPLTRKILTLMASLATFSLSGVWTTDSQSGFRAFSRRAIENIFVEVDRMEVSSDFFRQANENNLKIVEIEITPIYTEYSKRKGQNFLNSFNIIGKLAFRRLIK